MKRASIFTYVAKFAEKSVSTLSIFLSDEESTSFGIDSRLGTDLRNVDSIEAINLVLPFVSQRSLSEELINTDCAFIKRLIGLVGNDPDAIRILSLNNKTKKMQVINRHGLSHQLEERIIHIEQQESLNSVLIRSGSINTATRGTHYIHENRAHSEQFIKINHATESSSDLILISFWLMNKIKKSEPRTLLVDTSGIYAIALMAARLAIEHGCWERHPQIASFGSHHGVQKLTQDAIAGAVALISISNTNALEDALALQGMPLERTISIFGSKNSGQGSNGPLCIISPPISFDNYEKCEFCKQNSLAIHIHGDQFSLTPPRIKQIPIKGKDLPELAKQMFTGLSGLNTFRANVQLPSGEKSLLQFDSRPLFSATLTSKIEASVFLKDLRMRWESSVHQACTANLRLIAHDESSSSLDLAEKIQESTAHLLCTKPTLISIRDIPKQKRSPNMAAIVVAPHLHEGKQFLNASRSLRDIHPDGTITYLTLLHSQKTADDIKTLKTNLTYGQFGSGTFQMKSLLSIPIECHPTNNPWYDELQMLLELQGSLDEQDTDTPIEIENRIERLQSINQEGMINDLFWPTPTGEQLRLRNDFALFPAALSEPVISQADLFATFLTIISNLRTNENHDDRLGNSSYERSVLAPNVFDRFNDGILQSAILRAANPAELAYKTHSPNASKDIGDIFFHMTNEGPNAPAAEATPEFLIALNTKRMLVDMTHLTAAFLNILNIKNNWPKYIRTLVDHLLNKRS